MIDNICFLSATDLAEMVRTKALSPVEIVQAHLDRIDDVNPTLNAIVTYADDPLEMARVAEKEVMRDGDLGPLHGVPFTLKDCIEVKGLCTTQGSKLLENNVSEHDSTVFKRLVGAGGILLGKTNLPEFALWWETDNLVFGATHNPWDLGCTPGGSSGGEAASIVTGMSPLGVGTDLGGSIRQPSSYCGIVGLKPTLGRVPYTGVVPRTLFRANHTGPLARNVKDIALALSILAGPDGCDIYAPPVPVQNYTDLDGELSGLKIGWSPTGGTAVEGEVQDVVESASKALADLGFKVEPVEIPGLKSKDGGIISSLIYVAEGGAYLRSIVEGRESDLTPLLRQRYVEAPSKEFHEYLQAYLDWESLKWEVGEYFARYDVFLCPTVPMPAYPAGQTSFVINGETMAARHSLRATVPWDLTGSPAINVPFGWSAEGLPIGVQLVAGHFNEHTLLKVAKALEGCQLDRRKPPF